MKTKFKHSIPSHVPSGGNITNELTSSDSGFSTAAGTTGAAGCALGNEAGTGTASNE